jgi:predicted transposase YbfD/YdcC
VPAAASSPIPAVLDWVAPVANVAGGPAFQADPERMADLREHFARVPDPRKPRGIRHTLGSLLVIAAAAVCTGARSFTAIGEWAADAPQRVLALLGARHDPRRGRYLAPNEATVRRAMQVVDADAVDAAIGAWLGQREPRTTRPDSAGPDSAGPDSAPGTATTAAVIAVDGKTLRGTCGPDGTGGVHLLAAMTHQTGTVVAQTQVEDKTTEVAWFAPLLDRIDDLTGAVVTADALHTVRDHARYLTQRGADYVFIVKENRPRLYHLLDGLPWHQAPIHTTTDNRRGRHERRTIQVLPTPKDVEFPAAAQAFLVERYTTHATGKTGAIAVLGITSLTTGRASPPHIAFHARNHWHIENKLHYVRDVTYHEDHSQVRTANAPRVMASIRNLAISALHQTGHTNIAKALRHMARQATRPLTLLGIQS